MPDLTNPFDPQQNLTSFATSMGVPWYNYQKSLHPEESEQELWSRVAFNWNKGLFANYDQNNQDYLGQYNQYVQQYGGPNPTTSGAPRVTSNATTYSPLNTYNPTRSGESFWENIFSNLSSPVRRAYSALGQVGTGQGRDFWANILEDNAGREEEGNIDPLGFYRRI